MDVKRPLSEMTYDDLTIYAYASCSLAEHHLLCAKMDFRPSEALFSVKAAVRDLQTVVTLFEEYNRRAEIDNKKFRENYKKRIKEIDDESEDDGTEDNV